MNVRFLIVVLLATCAGSSTWAQSREMSKSVILGDTMYTLMQPGAIPAIFAPEFVGVEQASSTYAADEPLLVVSHAGDVRGYSTWHLDRHEVVNDRFDELPLAVTW
jgi:hypothetical protein